MERQEAYNIVLANVKNNNLVKHMLAVEAVMAGLAVKLDQNANDWRLAGLLHDADYEETKNDMPRQGVIIAEKLSQLGIADEICHAIKAHNDKTGTARQSLMDKAIYAADPLTGLIVASTLVLPSKKIADLTVENILNRFKEKSFAKGARRDAILSCVEINLSLEEFVSIALEEMKKISSNLGL
ncbi:HD domain-containing protein [Candidatus Parcubacteria bacterium]|nr:MAG: HD domain-containing protein [Candidatus Parcubacteria bacterium]